MSVDENILSFAKFLADHTKWIWEWRWRIHGKQWPLLSQHMHIPSKRRSLAKAAERCPVAFAHHFVSPAKYGYKHNTCHSIHRHSAQQLARERERPIVTTTTHFPVCIGLPYMLKSDPIFTHQIEYLVLISVFLLLEALPRLYFLETDCPCIP